MVWDPRLVFYVCVAKGPAVLAEYTSSAPAGLAAEAEKVSVLARRCLERTPPRHSSFSQTVRNRSYTFLIDESLTYFTISHEELGVGESLRFLERVKGEFRRVGYGIMNDKVTDMCFQGKMSPLFSELLRSDAGTVSSKDERRAEDERHRQSLSSPSKVLTTKKRFFNGGEMNAVHSGGDRLDVAHKRLSSMVDSKSLESNKEFSVPMSQGGSCAGDEKQKVKQIWRMHVWVVLVLDLVVCAVLLGIWLRVCGGFRCIDG